MNAPTMAQAGIINKIFKDAEIKDLVNMVRLTEPVKAYLGQRYSDMKRGAKDRVVDQFMGNYSAINGW